MSPDALPEEHRGRLDALKRARDILAEHFDLGFVVVSHMEEGQTRFARTEWGNKFGICKLSLDYADGELEEMLDDEDSDEDEDNEGWKKVS